MKSGIRETSLVLYCIIRAPTLRCTVTGLKLEEGQSSAESLSDTAPLRRSCQLAHQSADPKKLSPRSALSFDIWQSILPVGSGFSLREQSGNCVGLISARLTFFRPVAWPCCTTVNGIAVKWADTKRCRADSEQLCHQQTINLNPASQSICPYRAQDPPAMPPRWPCASKSSKGQPLCRSSFSFFPEQAPTVRVPLLHVQDWLFCRCQEAICLLLATDDYHESGLLNCLERKLAPCLLLHSHLCARSTYLVWSYAQNKANQRKTKLVNLHKLPR